VTRSLLATLCAASLAGLSCAVTPLPVAPPAAQAGTVARAAAHPSLEPTAAAVAGFLATRRTGLTRAEVETLGRVVVEEARRHGLDPELVLAVMHVESRFNAFALSPVGAMGLMQILPSTGEELAYRLGVPWHGARTLFDPVANVRLGVAYLKELSARYDDLTIALAAYNWGPGRIDRRLERGSELPTEYPRLVQEAHSSKTQGVSRSS
jgi:soluble lytic murein transglycosylase-like protein